MPMYAVQLRSAEEIREEAEARARELEKQVRQSSFFACKIFSPCLVQCGGPLLLKCVASSELFQFKRF